MTVKKRNFTAELKKAQEQGAKVVCSMAPYEGEEMVYQPRKQGDPSPWALKSGSTLFRYSGRECHAQWSGGSAPKKAVVLSYDQKMIMETLRSRNGGVWSPGCGWIWENRSTTIRFMNALARKGLVQQTSDEPYREEYRITEEGIAVAPTFAEKIQMLAAARQ